MEVMRERRERASQKAQTTPNSLPLHPKHCTSHATHKPRKTHNTNHFDNHKGLTSKAQHIIHIRRHTRTHNHNLKTSASRRSATPHPPSDAASAWAASRSLWSASRSLSSARRVATRGWRPWSPPPSGRRTAARGVSSAGSGNSRTRRAFPSSPSDPSRMRRR